MSDLVVGPCLEPADWDRLVDSVPWANPQHYSAWSRALGSCFGYLKNVSRMFWRNGQAVGALPLMSLAAGGPFRGLYSLVFDSYGGPLVHPDHLQDSELLARMSAEMDREAARERAFETRVVIPPFAPDSIRLAIANEGAERHERSCPVLDLGRPFEEIIAAYDPAVQRAVRRSARMGVEVEETSDPDLVHAAYSIYVATMRRIGGTIKPWRFIESLFRERLAIAFVARQSGRAVGLVVLLVSRRFAIYWISAADSSASNLRPTNALVDAAIRWCHGQGIARFSFGESPAERAGLLRFKQNWGPAPTNSLTVVRIHRPWVRRTWVALQPVARRAYSVWDRWKAGRRARAAAPPLTRGVPSSS